MSSSHQSFGVFDNLNENYLICQRNLVGDGPFIPGGNDLETGWIGDTGFISYEMFGVSAARYLAVDEFSTQVEVPIPDNIVYDAGEKRLLVSVIEDSFRSDQFPYVQEFSSLEVDAESFYSAAALKKSVGDFDLHPGNLVFRQDSGRVFAVDFHMAATKDLSENDTESSFVERTENCAEYLDIDFEEERLDEKEDEFASQFDTQKFRDDFQRRIRDSGIEIANEDVKKILECVENNV